MARSGTAVRRLTLVMLVAGFSALPPAPAEASGIETTELTIDFRKPRQATVLTRWSRPGVIQCQDAGLGWAGSPRTSHDGSLMIVKPMALGHPWWTATNASIRVELAWKGPNVAKLHGHVYMRHSPDLASWSDWSQVPRWDPRGDPEKHIHALHVNTPQPDASAWNALVRARTKGLPQTHARSYADVAAWAAKHRPGYLGRVRPFFGYMQFRYEGSFPGGHYLESLTVRITTVVPGPSYPHIKGASAEERRKGRELVWDHRAPGTIAPDATATRESEARAVISAALRGLIEQAKATSHKDPLKRATVCGRTAFGRDLLDLDTGGALPPRSPFWDEGKDAWRDVHRRNTTSRITSGGLGADEVTVEFMNRDAATYLMRGGNTEKLDPTSSWASYHARNTHSLGLVWTTEPGISADGKHAIVHLSHAWGPKQSTGTWYLLRLRAGAWRVFRTAASGKH